MKGVVWKEEERGVGVVWREEGVHKSYKYTATENGLGSQVLAQPVLAGVRDASKFTQTIVYNFKCYFCNHHSHRLALCLQILWQQTPQTRFGASLQGRVWLMEVSTPCAEAWCSSPARLLHFIH